MTRNSAIAIATHALLNGFVDNHDGSDQKMDVALIAENDNGHFFACFATRRASYFSINPMWKHHGVVSLSTAALGPVCDLRGKTLEQAVDDLNSFYAKPTVNNGFSKWHFEILEKPKVKSRFEQMVDEFNASQELIHINLIPEVK